MKSTDAFWIAPPNLGRKKLRPFSAKINWEQKTVNIIKCWSKKFWSKCIAGQWGALIQVSQLVLDESCLVLFWKFFFVKKRNDLAFHAGPVETSSSEGSPFAIHFERWKRNDLSEWNCQKFVKTFYSWLGSNTIDSKYDSFPNFNTKVHKFSFNITVQGFIQMVPRVLRPIRCQSF